MRRGLTVLAVAIAFSASACAPEEPDLETPVYGVPVFLGSSGADPAQVAAYIDASEGSLRDDGVLVEVSSVTLYALGTLKWFGRDVSGISRPGTPSAGMSVVWWIQGARSYAHERIHQESIFNQHGDDHKWNDPRLDVVQWRSRRAGRLTLVGP